MLEPPNCAAIASAIVSSPCAASRTRRDKPDRFAGTLRDQDGRTRRKTPPTEYFVLNGLPDGDDRSDPSPDSVRARRDVMCFREIVGIDKDGLAAGVTSAGQAPSNRRTLPSQS